VKYQQHRERRDAFGRDVVRGHVGHPPYAPYPLRARTPRRRCDCWSLRSAGEHSLVPSVASGCDRWRWSASRRTARGAPLAAGAAHVAGHAPGLPTRASGTGVTPPTPTDLPRAYKPAPAVPRTHALPPEPPSSAIGAARCEPPSSRHPHSPKRLSSPLCSTKPPRATCWSSRATHSPEPEFPRPPPDRRRRARPSVDSPSPVTCLAPSLGHMEAPRAARGWAQPLPSPPSEFPRARRRCSAAAARRWPPRPVHRHQSIAGESNRRSPSLVCLAVLHLAAGELATAVGPEREEPRAYVWEV
jgi:hypothetical protein